MANFNFKMNAKCDLEIANIEALNVCAPNGKSATCIQECIIKNTLIFM